MADDDLVVADDALGLEETLNVKDVMLLADGKRVETDERDALLERDDEGDTVTDFVELDEAERQLLEDADFDIELDSVAEFVRDGRRESVLCTVTDMVAALVFDDKALEKADFVEDADAEAVLELVVVRVRLDDTELNGETAEVREEDADPVSVAVAVPLRLGRDECVSVVVLETVKLHIDEVEVEAERRGLFETCDETDKVDVGRAERVAETERVAVSVGLAERVPVDVRDKDFVDDAVALIVEERDDDFEADGVFVLDAVREEVCVEDDDRVDVLDGNMAVSARKRPWLSSASERMTSPARLERSMRLADARSKDSDSDMVGLARSAKQTRYSRIVRMPTSARRGASDQQELIESINSQRSLCYD